MPQQHSRPRLLNRTPADTAIIFGVIAPQKRCFVDLVTRALRHIQACLFDLPRVYSGDRGHGVYFVCVGGAFQPILAYTTPAILILSLFAEY